MMEAMRIDAIKIPEKRLRSENDWSALAESIGMIGLLNPITVTGDGVLVSGLHRLRACSHLGWEKIPVYVTDVPAELAEIDENLIRVELTALERAEHLARRKQLYEAMHPETRHGANQHTRGEEAPERFTADTAKKTGASERTVRRQVAIAESLDDEARDLIRDTPVANNQQELARIAKLEPETQRAVAQKIADGEATNVKGARRQVRNEAPLPPLAGDVPMAVRFILDTVGGAVEKLVGEGGTVGFVTADPPWPYRNQRINGSTDGHYESYGVAEIVRDLDRAWDLAADDCYLALWCTGPFLAEWFETVRDYGNPFDEAGWRGSDFRWEFLSAGVWAKLRPAGKIGSGFHWRGDGEFLLLYRKGNPEPLATISNALTSEVTAHSEKPGKFCFDLVRAFCPRHQRVLDLYCGRAPTARACLGLGRPYIGVDNSEKRIHEAKKVIEDQRAAGRESKERARKAGLQV